MVIYGLCSPGLQGTDSGIQFHAPIHTCAVCEIADQYASYPACCGLGEPACNVAGRWFLLSSDGSHDVDWAGKIAPIVLAQCWLSSVQSS